MYMIFQLFLLKLFEYKIIECRLIVNYNMKIDKNFLFIKKYINIIHFFKIKLCISYTLINYI